MHNHFFSNIMDQTRSGYGSGLGGWTGSGFGNGSSMLESIVQISHAGLSDNVRRESHLHELSKRPARRQAAAAVAETRDGESRVGYRPLVLIGRGRGGDVCRICLLCRLFACGFVVSGVVVPKEAFKTSNSTHDGKFTVASGTLLPGGGRGFSVLQTRADLFMITIDGFVLTFVRHLN